MKDPREIAIAAAKALDARKAVNIMILDVRALTTITDYFVIASGRSASQVHGLAEYVDDELAKEGIDPKRRAGINEGRWAVLDYEDGVMVHIFHQDEREYYNLERLWMDGSNLVEFERIAEDE